MHEVDGSSAIAQDGLLLIPAKQHELSVNQPSCVNCIYILKLYYSVTMPPGNFSPCISTEQDTTTLSLSLHPCIHCDREL